MPVSTDSSAGPHPLLTRAEANEVLRYWLASLQLEEALSTRPRARRPLLGRPAPRTDTPAPGHDYFKVPLDAALTALLCEQTGLCKPLDAELGAFFETWLAAQYRRREEDRELLHLLAFPVVHLPRGELAGLLRCGLRVRFGDPGGPAFKVPTFGERRRKQYPKPPTEVRLGPAPRSGRRWPFFVDTRLLQQQLGVARESIDALFVALRQRQEITEAQMLALVCELLERELSQAELAAPDAPRASAGTVRVDEPPGAAELLHRIAEAMGRLLARRGGRARVYKVGVVLDGTRAKTTWYLQHELQLLLENRPEVAWDAASCLGAYLTAGGQPSGMAVQRSLFSGPPLSDSQRLAAERFWGSQLTAVQGPPGTGKTTLILHLAAEALVRQVEEFANDGVMGSSLLVVASTNNRAVDNVIDPFGNVGAVAGLPLALRAGSQKACEQLLAPRLAQTRAWLEQAQQRPAAERAAELTAALARFEAVRAELGRALAPRAHAFETETRRASLRFELAGLQAAALAGRAEPALDPRVAASLREPLQKAHKRLSHLCQLCEAAPGISQLTAVDRYYRTSAKRDLPALERASSAAGLSIELGLPPDLPPSTDPVALMEAWQEASEAALALLEGLRLRLESAADDARRQQRSLWVREQLGALGPEARVVAASGADSAPLQQAIFDAAVAVREAWAAVSAQDLIAGVEAAISAVRNESSLRSLGSDDARGWQRLRQLFCVWGCTLLSMGNCFPAQRDSIASLIIDEAGQCHPAHALGGLLRCKSALVIGDVHQLEPVIDLEPGDDERVIESCKLALSEAALAPYRIHNQAQCSVQALADRAVDDRPRLTDHFRCQPEIIAICDALCDYGLRVHTPRVGPPAAAPFLAHAVSLVDVAGEQERLGGSWHNAAELAMTLELVQALLAAGIEPDEVAIITPYRGQLEQLRKHLLRMRVPIDYSAELLELEDQAAAAERGLALGTVHRFQGGERNIVIFTSVVTRRSSLGFLDQRENLLNVAVSRARHRLIAVGHRAVLETGRRTRLLARAAAPLAAEAFRIQLGLSP